LHHLSSLGLEIGVLCGSLYSILLLNAILGQEFLGPALSRPQVKTDDSLEIDTKKHLHDMMQEGIMTPSSDLLR
jgi:hypothetical protein